MQSAFWIVDSRCAIAIVVRPFAARSSASCTTFSEFESSADVASSSSRMRGFRSSARAMAIRCFWPPDSCEPLPPTSVSKPLQDQKNSISIDSVMYVNVDQRERLTRAETG